MHIVEQSISVAELKGMSFEKLVKAVVDVEKGIMTVDSDMHADQEAFLLEQGSKQGDLWGINIYPYATEENQIELTSLINFRPSWGNRSKSIENPEIQTKIIKIVHRLIKP